MKFGVDIIFRSVISFNHIRQVATKAQERSTITPCRI